MNEHITDRIDAVTEVTGDFARPDPPAPKSLKISITERCNHSCGYCALRLRPHRSSEMSQETYQRIVKEAAEFGVKEIGVFFMGEPTMLPWIGDAVRIAKSHVPYVFMTSNGTHHWAVERYRDCMEAGLDSLKFSLNYSDPEQYEKVTGRPASHFYRIEEAIKRTREARDKAGLPTKLWASSIQYDGEQAERMAAVIGRVEPFLDGPVYFLPLYSFGAFATTREKELGFKPTAGNQGRIGALRAPLPCWTCFTSAHVGVDEGGRPYLSACCFDASGKWEMADLSSTSFAEAWNSEKFQVLRAAHLGKDVTGTICERCIAYE